MVIKMIDQNVVEQVSVVLKNGTFSEIVYPIPNKVKCLEVLDKVLGTSLTTLTEEECFILGESFKYIDNLPQYYTINSSTYILNFNSINNISTLFLSLPIPTSCYLLKKLTNDKILCPYVPSDIPSTETITRFKEVVQNIGPYIRAARQL